MWRWIASFGQSYNGDVFTLLNALHAVKHSHKVTPPPIFVSIA